MTTFVICISIAKNIIQKNKMNRFREKPQRFVEKSKMKKKNLT